MAEDPALPLTDVQLVLGHALLTTTQLYLTPRKEDVIRRILAHHAEQVRQARQRARPAPAPGYRPESLDVLFGKRDVVTGRGSPRRQAASVWLAGYRAARTRFPPRPPAADWPASTQAREQVHEHLAGLRPGQAGALGAAAGLAAGPGRRQLAAALAGQRRRGRRARVAAAARPAGGQPGPPGHAPVPPR